MRKRVEKSEAILALLSGFQELHLDWYARVITAFDVFFFFFSGNFMKSSVLVFAAGF